MATGTSDGFFEIGAGETWDGVAPVQGLYVHRQENVGPNNSMLYSLRTSDGDIGVWGSTVLDSRFAQIKIGQEVRIVPDGLSKPAPGKKAAKLFKVFVRDAPATETTGARDDVQIKDLDNDSDDNINVEDLPY